MAAALGKSIVSRLITGLQATPAVSRETVEALGKLLEELQQPHVTKAEAEKRLRKWLESVPPHAATVLQSVILGSRYLRIVSEDSWVYKVFSTLPTPAPK
ncbi:MAG: hypothetical protein ACREJJ_07575 [Candidatus Methylomirabilales bacterium]